MFAGKKCVAMILAGGQGNRLGVLTKYRAKPAVPFGGKYRIIDFTLSNCSNSGIDTVGVLTQYQPLELNSYIGTGSPWDLDGTGGGAFVLPPYVSGNAKGRWYTGTANAVYQNTYFIDRYSPEYLLVLSGDHIYKMDYNDMLVFHKEKHADVTVGSLRVPLCDAHRYGIIETDGDGRITGFQEKPKTPKGDLASMGIYVFSWQKIREYLKADAGSADSSNDFGKDVLPAMLNAGERMYSYPFSGYWKDVGTVESLWEANMELLQHEPPIDLRDPGWKIYARDPNMPPNYTSDTAQTVNCMIAQGCHVYGKAEGSILFPGVTLMEDAEVYDSIIMPGTYIGEGAVIRRTIIDENVYIGAYASVGDGGDITVIGSSARICRHACVPCGERIEPKSRVRCTKEEDCDK